MAGRGVDGEPDEFGGEAQFLDAGVRSERLQKADPRVGGVLRLDPARIFPEQRRDPVRAVVRTFISHGSPSPASPR